MIVDRQGELIVVSAPSGAGKTSLLAEIMKQDVQENKRLSLSISYTTRQSRKGEENGVDYFFVTQEEFKSMQCNNEFLESATVYGENYGTGKRWTECMLAQKKDVVLEIDVQGALQVMESRSRVCTIFIFPPSMADLEKRLYDRGTDSNEEIQKRLKIAKDEIGLSHYFDYWITNDDYQRAVMDIQSIIRSQHLKRRDDSKLHT